MSRKRLWSAAVAFAISSLLAACGSSNSSSTSSSASGASSSASATASTSTTAASGAKPGAGKPPIVIGDKNFTEEYILGDLYAQALKAKGYTVVLKPNIGSSEITWKALTSGQIQMYPEYDGTLLTAIFNDNKPPTSAEQTFQLAKADVTKKGYTLLSPTPFFDTDALAATKAYTTAHHLTSIADLKPLGSSVKLGGAPEFRTRLTGLIGLKQAYGINPTFVPLSIGGITYKALDSGQVNLVDAFSTDAQLTSGKYTLLKDPKNVFGFQYVTPVVKQSIVTAEGPAFADTVNKVSALLTLPAIQKMNAAVALDQQDPAKVAQQFLAANGLA